MMKINNKWLLKIALLTFLPSVGVSFFSFCFGILVSFLTFGHPQDIHFWVFQFIAFIFIVLAPIIMFIRAPLSFYRKLSNCTYKEIKRDEDEDGKKLIGEDSIPKGKKLMLTGLFLFSAFLLLVIIIILSY